MNEAMKKVIEEGETPEVSKDPYISPKNIQPIEEDRDFTSLKFIANLGKDLFWETPKETVVGLAKLFPKSASFAYNIVAKAYEEGGQDKERKEIENSLENARTQYFANNPNAEDLDWYRSEEYKEARFEYTEALTDLLEDPEAAEIYNGAVMKMLEEDWGSGEAIAQGFYERPAQRTLDILSYLIPVLKATKVQKVVKFANQLEKYSDPLINVPLDKAARKSSNRLAKVEDQEIIKIAEDLGIPQEDIPLILGSDSRVAGFAESPADATGGRARRMSERDQRLNEDISRKEGEFKKSEIADEIDIDTLMYEAIDGGQVRISQRLHDRLVDVFASVRHDENYIDLLTDPSKLGITKYTAQDAAIMGEYIGLLSRVLKKDAVAKHLGGNSPKVIRETIEALYARKVLEMAPTDAIAAINNMKKLGGLNVKKLDNFIESTEKFGNLINLKKSNQERLDFIKNSTEAKMNTKGFFGKLDALRESGLPQTVVAAMIGGGAAKSVAAGVIFGGLTFAGKHFGSPAVKTMLESDQGRKWLLRGDTDNKLKAALRWSKENNIQISLKFGARREAEE